MHAKRAPLVRSFLTLAALVGGSGGCALLYQLDTYSVSSGDAGLAAASGADSGRPELDAGANTCVSNAACATAASLAGQDDATVCVRSTGKCVALRSVDCPGVQGDYLNDDAIFIGSLLGSDGNSALERAALLAAEEIRSLPPTIEGGANRPLVVVSCDPHTDVLRATRHLAEDLRVPAIVGPLSDQDVIAATQQVTSKSGTLLFSPNAQSSSISNLSDADLTWRNLPSDSQRANLLIDQLNELETLLRSTRALTSIRFAAVYQNDVRGLSVRDSIAGKLLLNGRFINDAFNAGFVSLDSYGAPGDSATKALVSKYASTFKPDMILVTSEDQVANLIIPLENALTAARATLRPYYICTDAAKTKTLLDAIESGTLPADIRRRIRGVGVKPDTASESALAAFTTLYTTRHGAIANPIAAAPAYDATYAIAAAIAATPTRAPSGASIAEGLRQLGVGTPVSIGAKDVNAMLSSAARGSISLRGTLSLMRWEPSGDVLEGTLEVWCIGRAAVPAFGSSGRTMDVQAQVIGGGFIQCQ
jgi:ABC-type branched-subunit amino acid transport system substrate-binding protein